DFRLRDLCQRPNFSRMRHPHLNDGYVVLRLELQQHEWQAEVVVEVAFGLKHAKLRTQNMSDGFFCRCLSGGTSDPDQRLTPNLTYACGESLQGDERVIDRQQARLIRVTMQFIFAHDGRDRALFQSASDEIVAVEALSFDREKKLAWANGA